ncbi:MAG: GDSL-type esterase/lipase family protein [Kiritimatiellae bacterium]|nr:GDSL-type esterase/lipase family protein [Kiritimatiellia bacterium]
MKKLFLDRLWLFVAVFSVGLGGPGGGQAEASALPAAPAPFADGDRVLFLGDSITRAGAWHSLISLFYATRFPDQRLTWLNAGISGDTAAGAVQRLEWDVLEREPDHVVIMFGINDIDMITLYHEQTPEKLAEREARIEQYTASMEELIVRLKNEGIGVIICTPSPYEETAEMDADVYEGANAAVTRCARISLELAARHDVPAVDFNGPMNAINADFQKTNPGFTLIGTDRVHPGATGNLVMAHLFLKAQGLSGTVSDIVIDARDGVLTSADNSDVSDLKAATDHVAFTALEKALPVPLQGGERRGAQLVPFQSELNRQMLTITGLADGQYELLIDGEEVGRWWQDDFAAGINLAHVRTTPQYKQASEVRRVHDQRHGTAGGPLRMIAFTRLFTLMPLGLDENETEAVEKALTQLIEDRDAFDKPGLGFSSFGQSMARRYLTEKPREAQLTARIAEADDQVHVLNRPGPRHYIVRPVTHDISVEQRREVFAQRRNPERLEAFAREFLGMLIVDGDGLMRTNLRRRPALERIRSLVNDEKPVEALDVFRDYFMAKLRNPAGFGMPEGFMNVTAPGGGGDHARADELLNHVVQPGQPPMAPGEVWLPRPKEGVYGAANPWNPGRFSPLANAYIATGEQKYLDTWIDYMDDWAMFETTHDRIKGTDISDGDQRLFGQIHAVLRTLASIDQVARLKEHTVPADSFARIVRRLIELYMPIAIVYHDTNPQNWTPGASAGQLHIAAMFDEFLAAEYMFSRARHRQANYGTIQFLPDGSETEHSLWYNLHYSNGARNALRLSESRGSVDSWRRPHWERDFVSADYQLEQWRRLRDRARFFIQMMTPQGQYPIGNRIDYRRGIGGSAEDLVNQAIARGDSDLQVLMGAMYGNAPHGDPGFTMTRFPYHGSYIMRTGWSDDSDYAHFYSVPFPSGGHALEGMKASNSFWLSAGGQDMLVSGRFGAYSFNRSPLRVDGREQFANAGVPHPGKTKSHKGFGVAYVDPLPPEWRSHSSARFDLAEGIYAGPYGELVDDHHDDKSFPIDMLAEAARNVITGVSHHRQALQLKDAGLWLVVDRLQSGQPRTYALDWRLPVKAVETFPGDGTERFSGKTFEPEDIQLDEANQMLVTSSRDMPNLTIRYFGPEMTFTAEREDGANIKHNYTIRSRVYDHWHVSGAWASEGNDLLLSLIETRPENGESRIAHVEPLGNGQSTRGFKARTADGQEVAYLAAVEGQAELSVNGVTLVGESLLMLGDHGIALGSASMTVHGRAIDLKAADFEFDMSGGQLQMATIHTPILPVRVLPARAVVQANETISLHCDTPGVELRYTIDGSEPTLHSPLYTGPFTVNGRVTVKARAFRLGLERMPATLEGTHVTPVTVAAFTTTGLLGPVTRLEQNRRSPGLRGAYYEDDWKTLVFFPELAAAPVRTREVNELFERVQPNVDKVFGWTYTGFLAIPEDGVYTFHAPEELVNSRQEPGYALRLFVGQEQVNNRGTGRLNEWYPESARHAYGTWSIGLQKGIHPFELRYVDYRTDAMERKNHPGMRMNVIWDGRVPQVEVSGPDLPRQPIPQSWLYR